MRREATRNPICERLSRNVQDEQTYKNRILIAIYVAFQGSCGAYCGPVCCDGGCTWDRGRNWNCPAT